MKRDRISWSVWWSRLPLPEDVRPWLFRSMAPTTENIERAAAIVQHPENFMLRPALLALPGPLELDVHPQSLVGQDIDAMVFRAIERHCRRYPDEALGALRLWVSYRTESGPAAAHAILAANKALRLLAHTPEDVEWIVAAWRKLTRRLT